MEKLEELEKLNKRLEIYCGAKIANRLKPYIKISKQVNIVASIIVTSIVSISLWGKLDSYNVLLPIFGLFFYLNSYLLKEDVVFNFIKYKDGERKRYNCYHEDNSLYKVDIIDMVFLTIKSLFGAMMLSILQFFLFMMSIYVFIVDSTSPLLIFTIVGFGIFMMFSYILFACIRDQEEGQRKPNEEMETIKQSIESELNKVRDHDIKGLLFLRKDLNKSKLKNSMLSNLVQEEIQKKLHSDNKDSIEDYVLEEKTKELSMETY
tara:strand:- start:25460 stop:26248 length:789 start_codon:yes stop_codon:yes gene_type:complete